MPLLLDAPGTLCSDSLCLGLPVTVPTRATYPLQSYFPGTLRSVLEISEPESQKALGDYPAQTPVLILSTS